MAESNCRIHAHIRKPDEYKISIDNPYQNSIVIKTGQGDVILTIERKVALMLAMDLIKAVVTRMRQELNQEIKDLSDLKN
jgi:hypothetical protein